MSKDLIRRCIWIMDTIRRHRRITLKDLSSQWMTAPFSPDSPLLRRTFYNYRKAIMDAFNVSIECDPVTFEYYVAESDERDSSMINCLLNANSVSNMLTGARDVAGRIFLEPIPSARYYLETVVDAMRDNKVLNFDYSPYYRSQTSHGLAIEPYFLKIFRQRWYLTGRNVAEDRIKTYALDRMSKVSLSTETFRMPAGFDIDAYVRYSFGIVFSEGKVHRVVIRVDSRRAKYLRTLPLHPSQQEMVHDDFSDFYYQLRITPDLVRELLSFGSSLTVISPPELRLMVEDELRKALAHYEER